MTINRLNHALASLLPADVAFACGPLHEHFENLFEVERSAIATAHDKRRREFSTGRSYARHALASLGCPPQPLPVGEARQVIWPAGFIGSISHSDQLCAAIGARSSSYWGVGLDLETDSPLEDEALRRLICRPEEGAIAWAGGDVVKLLFVIKEAVFKAYYPGTAAFLEFDDLSVIINAAAQSFRARIVRKNIPALGGYRCFDGGFRFAEGHLAAAVFIPRPR
jgi:enterobactin synthetase component D / holo-[acyl-carrier protein] synthase